MIFGGESHFVQFPKGCPRRAARLVCHHFELSGKETKGKFYIKGDLMNFIVIYIMGFIQW